MVNKRIYKAYITVCIGDILDVQEGKRENSLKKYTTNPVTIFLMDFLPFKFIRKDREKRLGEITQLAFSIIPKHYIYPDG